MKLLHTSDWHLGHTLYNFDRTEEQRAMLRQIADIVRDQKPDVFLLCGDVYHTAQPSAAVQTMLMEALMEIRDANPGMTIVVTAGNHDSGSKIDIFRTPWRVLKVNTIGNLNKEDINDHIIEIPEKGFIIAVPYFNSRNMPENFFQYIMAEVNDRNFGNLPVVMTAHTTVKGCDFTGHDNSSEYVVGGIDSLDINQLGDGYDYLALGHIHHAQFIHTGKHNVRYSGTPIAVSFDETYPHSVSIVEIDKHGEKPKVETVGIDNPHPLVTLPTEGMATWEDAKKLLANYPDDISSYIRLNVEIEDFLPVEANAEAQALTKEKKCKLCYINTKRKQQSSSEAKSMSISEFQAESPIEIAKRYAEDIGIPFDDEMQSLFKETLQLLNHDI